MSYITLYEFKQLPKQEQHSVTHNEGTFLDVIEEGKKRFVLFGLGKFYVQLTYDVPSNKIIFLETFKRGVKLDRYLDQYQV